ncbi:MAG: ribbon-helix-helix protein, CopG family [Alphaproteobacteria bacterium]|nr:ribbon-helix-helix protein, CopG family [Alphaproteobacteria bacterium]
MNEEPKDHRVPIMMSQSEIEAVDDWAFANRIRSRSEAIRRLVRLGLEAPESEKRSDESR